jgi:hypothetical protein
MLITRSWGLYLALFACAYAGFFFASRPAAFNLRSVAGSTHFGIVEVPRLDRGTPQPASTTSHADQPAGPSTSPESRRAPAAISLEEQARAQELSNLAIDSEEGEDRLAAMQGLSVLHPSLAVPTLQQVLRQSTDVRERLRAVAILQKLAEQGDPDKHIEFVLRDAASDADEHVAALARDAWDRLSRR